MRIRELLQEVTKPLAIIIKGNPKYLDQMKKEANTFYSKIKQILEQQGYSVEFDPGDPYTSPKPADLWVGHSRGVDRLQFAPPHTKTLVIMSNSVDGFSPKHYELSSKDIALLKQTNTSGAGYSASELKNHEKRTKNWLRKNDSLFQETPLPDDWDKDIYNDRIPFKTRVRYAKERAMQMGVGSSRIAFKIPYQGRDTVLKIAKNRKGMAQNKAEVDLLGEGLIQNIGIVIPLIDYDTENSTPTWIHTEFAEKIRPNQMKQFTNNLDLLPFMECAAYESGSLPNETYHMTSITDSFDSEISQYNLNDLDLYHQVKELIGNYKGVVVWQDLVVTKNWGLYKGSPVIIDLGFTEDVRSTHYT